MNKIVKLSTPVEAFGKMVTQITLKEPSGGDYVRNGEPQIIVYTSSGGAYPVRQEEVISKYYDSCIEHEMGAALMDLLSLEDAMEVKEQIVGFFSRPPRGVYRKDRHPRLRTEGSNLRSRACDDAFGNRRGLRAGGQVL